MGRMRWCVVWVLRCISACCGRWGFGGGVDDARGFDGGVGDAFDHGDDVVTGFFEPLVGVVDDAAGFVGFDVVAVDDPL